MHAYGAYGPYVVRQAQKPCPQSLGCSPWKDSPGGTVVRISISRKLFLRIIWASFTLDAFEEIALASRRTTEWGTCCMHVRNRRSNSRDEILVQLLLNNLFYTSTHQIIFISAVSLHIHIYVVAHLGAKSYPFSFSERWNLTLVIVSPQNSPPQWLHLQNSFIPPAPVDEFLSSGTYA